MYLDYTFYKTEFGGKVPEDDFKSLNIQASGLLNFYTFERISNITEVPIEIKYALCELVNLLHEEAEQHTNISTEKVGSYSVSYGGKNGGRSGEMTYAQKQRKVIHKWIPSKLLYRGV